MNRVVKRAEELETSLQAAEKRFAVASQRRQWQSTGLNDLRLVAQLCGEKRRRREKPSDDELTGETVLFERSFPDFIRSAWSSAVLGVPLVWGRHHELLAEALQAVIEGQIRRLLITIEPRSTKSTLLSVMLTPWTWASNPSFRTIHASMKAELAVRDSVTARRLIESRWYQSRWALRLQADQDQKARYETVQGGCRVSVGPGQGTGDGGDLVALDDPHPIDSASSEADLLAVKQWFNSTLLTRLNDPKTGRLIVCGQRVAKDDLIGHLIETGMYHHLCLPHEFEPARKSVISLPNGKVIEDWRTRRGELLWPQRCDEAATAVMKSSMSGDVYDAVFQQNPRLHGAAAAFPEFDGNVHVKPCPYDPSLPICWSLDFNVCPFVTLVIQHKDGVVRVIREIAIEDIRTPQMCEAFVGLAEESKWDLKGLEIYGDASGSQRRTSASESDWAIVQDRMKDWLAGWSLNVPDANPPIKDTLAAIRAKLLSVDGATTLFIDPSCKLLIRDMERATWPSTMEQNHALAALRYFCHTEFRIDFYTLARGREPWIPQVDVRGDRIDFDRF